MHMSAFGRGGVTKAESWVSFCTAPTWNNRQPGVGLRRSMCGCFICVCVCVCVCFDRFLIALYYRISRLPLGMYRYVPGIQRNTIKIVFRTFCAYTTAFHKDDCMSLYAPERMGCAYAHARLVGSMAPVLFSLCILHKTRDVCCTSL